VYSVSTITGHPLGQKLGVWTTIHPTIATMLSDNQYMLVS